jgi:hypothetical protein
MRKKIIFLLIVFLFHLLPVFLFDYLICPVQNRLRTCQVERHRCSQIDDKLELHWLFDRQVSWLAPVGTLLT